MIYEHLADPFATLAGWPVFDPVRSVNGRGQSSESRRPGTASTRAVDEARVGPWHVPAGAESQERRSRKVAPIGASNPGREARARNHAEESTSAGEGPGEAEIVLTRVERKRNPCFLEARGARVACPGVVLNEGLVGFGTSRSTSAATGTPSFGPTRTLHGETSSRSRYRIFWAVTPAFETVVSGAPLRFTPLPWRGRQELRAEGSVLLP